MSSLRLEELPFELDGRQYVLRCNMNVLAEVQDDYDGDFAAAMDDKHSLRSVMCFLAAMLNDYAEEQGWPERFNARDRGRRLKRHQVPGNEIMAMVVQAIVPPKTDEEKPANAGN